MYSLLIVFQPISINIACTPLIVLNKLSPKIPNNLKMAETNDPIPPSSLFSPTKLSTPNKPAQFRQQPYRWVVISIYSFLAVFMGAATVTLFPIATVLVDVYAISSLTINSVALVYLLLFTLIGFPANYFIDTHGLRTGLIIGTIVYSCGCTLQMFVNYSFWAVVSGCVLIGCAQPFILNCIGKVATYWFFKEHRTMICSVLTLLNLLGTGIGFVIPTLLVNGDDDNEVVREQVFNVMLIEGIPAFILTGVVLVFMKAKPDTPPSLGGEVDKMPFRQSVSALAKNKNFLLIFFGFSMYYGPLATLSSMMNFLFKPFDFTDFQISIFGMLVILCGAIGAICFSLYIARTQRFSFTLKLTTTIAFFLFSTSLLGLWLNFPFFSFCLLFAVLGMLVTPVYSVSYDLSCETSFPVGEAQVIGVMNSGGNILAMILIMVVQFGIDFGTREKSYTAMVVMLAVVLVATGCFWGVKDQLVRIEAEKANQMRKSVEMSDGLAGQGEGKGANNIAGQSQQASDVALDIGNK